MIVEQFIQWVVNAGPEKRAKATRSLSRAFLNGEFDEYDRDAAEAAMMFLLDDPDRKVRFALADSLAGEENAPRHVILALLDDVAEIGALVAGRSPILIDQELIDIVASRELSYQLAVAGRSSLSASVSAAIAEVTSKPVCERLLKNEQAEILPSTLFRIAERFLDYIDIQQLLLKRPNLPITARQFVVVSLSDVLCEFAVQEDRMDQSRVKDVARDARDRATLTLARNLTETDLRSLVVHLRDTHQLTTLLMLRAICAGNVTFFIEALALLTDVPQARVVALLEDNASKILRPLYQKAGLPEEAYSAFAIAFEVYVEEGAVVDASDQYRFTRLMIERVLDRYRSEQSDSANELLAMLRRFASETARDAARNLVHHQIKAA